MRQILWNLLSNAVKFTPRGGTITVRVTRAGSIPSLTVHDTGRGIEARYLPHVFERFAPEDASMTPMHEGMGLGLSIARSLVALHGGRIRASSDGPGRGATFTVELPLLEPARRISERSASRPRAAAEAVAGASPLLRGARVPVIDDQDVTRDLVAAVFPGAQAEVGAASSVREGVAELNGMAPDVVACDLAMPDEDGYALPRIIRALPSPTSATPVIALTAFGRPEVRQHALAAGCDEYLKKPIDPADLSATVLRLTPNAHR